MGIRATGWVRGVDGAAVCGAEPVAGQDGRGGRCVALVQSLASSAPQQGGTSRRRPGGPSTAMATTCTIAADRGGIGSVATVGDTRRPLRRHIMAGANSKAIGPAINLACPRSPSQAPPSVNLRLPTPLRSSGRQSRPPCRLNEAAGKSPQQSRFPEFWPLSTQNR